MKKLINAPENVVAEMLRGMELAHGGMLRVIHDFGVVLRADAPVQGKVALISGGGSWHEPTHGGFVGPGMLEPAALPDATLPALVASHDWACLDWPALLRKLDRIDPGFRD